MDGGVFFHLLAQMVEKAPLDRDSKSRYHDVSRQDLPPAQLNISGTQVRQWRFTREVG